jgi:bacterioferritin-associated ferredoxin
VYACICHAVTEEQVRSCSGGGLRQVVTATRAGSGCGTCVQRLRTLLEQPVPVGTQDRLLQSSAA